LGGGSNVVVADAGLDGLVLIAAQQGIAFESMGERTRVTACAGVSWDVLVAECVQRELAGIECLSGIPGLVGATPIQNVGAYGQEVAETIESVRAYDRRQRAFVEIPAIECRFSYRDSRFKSDESGRFVITEVRFVLGRSEPSRPRYPELARALEELGRTPTLSDVRGTVLKLRRSKSMLADADDPNGRSCGSFFLNPVVPKERASAIASALATNAMPQYPQPEGSVKLSAAWLIEQAGLTKGLRRGNVGISSKHALALVCHDGATAAELLEFSRWVQATVEARTGVSLTPEPQFFGQG
jgi:UDP-N-acetylmuramate dehydrogenase